MILDDFFTFISQLIIDIMAVYVYMLIRPTSGGSMNPVRTLGPAIAAGNYKHIWIYLVAPTLGALAGAGVYTLVKLRDSDAEAEPPRQVRSFRR